MVLLVVWSPKHDIGGSFHELWTGTTSVGGLPPLSRTFYVEIDGFLSDFPFIHKALIVGTEVVKRALELRSALIPILVALPGHMKAPHALQPSRGFTYSIEPSIVH